MAEARMRDHQRLHHHRILFHQIGDAGIGIVDDFVGETLPPLAVGLLVGDEFLAVRPMLIARRQADRRIGVQHLFGGDDFNLVRIRIQAELRGTLADFIFIALD